MEKRLTADLNVVANSNLEIQLLDGDLNIIQKLDDEPNDVGGLTSAELKAKFDESGNIIKKYINETLIPAVLTDDATEESRKQAEAARVAAEQGRVTAEEGRVSAESGRVSAEQARSNAESSRVSAENARETAEQARADETAGIVARATAQANAAAGSASQAAGSEQSAKDAAGTAIGAASSASQSAAAASGSASQASAAAASAAQSAASVDGINKTAQSWAVGGTGTRPGEDTDNAKYWAQQAQAAVGGGFATKKEAQGYVTAHNQSVDAHPDLRVAVAGAVRYDEAQSLTDEQKAQARTNIGADTVQGAVLYTPQSLTDTQQTQARGNINAANGTFKTVHLDKIGWYRIATCKFSGSGILSLQHGCGSGGPSSLKFLVTMDVFTPALKCIDTDCFRPQFTNARLVTVAENLTAIDVYYNVAYDNSPVICFIQTGQNSVAIQEPSYISDSDALPNGEALLAPMEYLNPPMQLGVEYRTTERHLGKPVYCKVVDFGTAPNNDTKNVSLSGMNIDEVCDAIFHYYVPRNGENGVMTCHPNFTGLLVSNGVIQIRTNTNTTDTNFYVTIKYTKTTD